MGIFEDMTQSTDMALASGLSGSSFRVELNTQLAALNTMNKGPSAPTYATQGTNWIDDSGNPIWLWKIYDGGTWITVGTINTTNDTFSPANTATVNGSTNFGSDLGSDDAYAVDNDALGTPVLGTQINFLATTANTGAATLTVNSGSTLAIKKPGGFDLITGDILAGQIVSVVQASSYYQLMNVADQNPLNYYGTTTNSGNAYSLTLSPAFTSAKTGVPFSFKVNAANTATPTLNVSGTGAKSVKKSANLDLAAGDFKANQILQAVYDGTNYQLLGFSSAGTRDYVHIQDQKTNGTAGGSITANTRTTRDLNIIVSDEASRCVLSSNQFTLDPGDYEIMVVAPSFSIRRNKLILFNVTDSVDIMVSGNAISNDDVGCNTILTGRFTIGSGKALSIQQICQISKSGNGLGVETSFGLTEVYTDVQLWKVA